MVAAVLLAIGIGVAACAAGPGAPDYRFGGIQASVHFPRPAHRLAVAGKDGTLVAWTVVEPHQSDELAMVSIASGRNERATASRLAREMLARHPHALLAGWTGYAPLATATSCGATHTSVLIDGHLANEVMLPIGASAVLRPPCWGSLSMRSGSVDLYASASGSKQDVDAFLEGPRIIELGR